MKSDFINRFKILPRIIIIVIKNVPTQKCQYYCTLMIHLRHNVNLNKQYSWYTANSRKVVISKLWTMRAHGVTMGNLFPRPVYNSLHAYDGYKETITHHPLRANSSQFTLLERQPWLLLANPKCSLFFIVLFFCLLSALRAYIIQANHLTCLQFANFCRLQTFCTGPRIYFRVHIFANPCFARCHICSKSLLNSEFAN